jgi:hypothetical protein
MNPGIGLRVQGTVFRAVPAEKVWVPKENWYEAPAKKDEEKK